MTIDELERCILRLLSLARSRGIEKIDTGPRDYYWSIPAPEWVDMTKEPKPAVGSLDDDVSELSKLLEDLGTPAGPDWVLTPDTTYYWRIDEKDAAGNYTAGT